MSMYVFVLRIIFFLIANRLEILELDRYILSRVYFHHWLMMSGETEGCGREATSWWRKTHTWTADDDTEGDWQAQSVLSEAADDIYSHFITGHSITQLIFFINMVFKW